MSRSGFETLRYNRINMAQDLYSSIVVQGADALEFLQGQLTADLAGLLPGQSLLSAWCNPKGRVICLLRVTATGSGYTLALPTELADDVIKRLTLFRFRSKVEFTVRPATEAESGIDPDAIEAGLLQRLRDGIPEIWRAQSEKFTPHMLNLDLLGAVSFDKGCYTGQEVVARTHYRGSSRRRLLRFVSTSPVRPGDKVADGERDIGEVLNAVGNDLLAVVPVDKSGAELSVSGIILSNRPLPYLKEE